MSVFFFYQHLYAIKINLFNYLLSQASYIRLWFCLLCQLSTTGCVLEMKKPLRDTIALTTEIKIYNLNWDKNFTLQNASTSLEISQMK